MDIKVVDENGTEEVKVQQVPSTPLGSAVDGLSTMENSINSLFNFDRQEERLFKDKVRTLIDYAKTQTDEPTVENIRWVLRNLQLKLGTPPLGERMINHMVRYATLSMEHKRTQKELEKYI